LANKFSAAPAHERKYAADLRKIASIVAGIIRSYVSGEKIADVEGMTAMLAKYSESLSPWAVRAADGMIKAVDLRNRKAFNSSSKEIADKLRQDNSVSLVVPSLQAAQVKLIKSLPIQAGERAQRLAQEAAISGARSTEIALALARTEEITLTRATLIARTEVAKANVMITQARAQAAGLDYYIWQTAEDADVRESHAEMAGDVFRFDQPPTLSDGMTGNPGEFPNCRCFAIPVIQ
jgi:SPP1 gp7 family putative phage head morphogenesis protein